MQCNNCGGTNPAGANYCANCGWAIEPLANETINQRQLEFTGERRLGGSVFEPRNLSELLVESARVYRKNLPVFLGVGLIPQVPGLLGLGPLPLWWAITLIITSLGLTALSFGAIAHAVAVDYLGLTPTVGSSYSHAWQRVAPLEACLIIHGVLLAGSLLLSLLLVGIPMFFLLLILLWFYPQAIMLENLGPVEAFSRSISLVRGNWWRNFGTGVTYWVIPVALALGAFSLSNDPANSKFVGIFSAIIGTVTYPWIMIGSTLMYFDLRVRKEGYSVELLEADLEKTGPP